jgi:hypothetical protein
MAEATVKEHLHAMTRGARALALIVLGIAAASMALLRAGGVAVAMLMAASTPASGGWG